MASKAFVIQNFLFLENRRSLSLKPHLKRKFTNHYNRPAITNQFRDWIISAI